MNDVVFLNPRDSVATTTRAFEAGEELQVDGRAVRLLQAIPFAHKVAVKPIPQGQPVYKYGHRRHRGGRACPYAQSEK